MPRGRATLAAPLTAAAVATTTITSASVATTSLTAAALTAASPTVAPGLGPGARRGAVCSGRDEATLQATAGRVSRAAITRCSRHCAARTTATAILARRLELGRPLSAMYPSHPSLALLRSRRSSRRLSCLYAISRLLRDPSAPRRPSALWPRATRTAVALARHSRHGAATRAAARSQCGLSHHSATSCRPSW